MLRKYKTAVTSILHRDGNYSGFSFQLSQKHSFWRTSNSKFYLLLLLHLPQEQKNSGDHRYGGITKHPPNMREYICKVST